MGSLRDCFAPKQLLRSSEVHAKTGAFSCDLRCSPAEEDPDNPIPAPPKGLRLFGVFETWLDVAGRGRHLGGMVEGGSRCSSFRRSNSQICGGVGPSSGSLPWSRVGASLLGLEDPGSRVCKTASGSNGILSVLEGGCRSCSKMQPFRSQVWPTIREREEEVQTGNHLNPQRRFRTACGSTGTTYGGHGGKGSRLDFLTVRPVAVPVRSMRRVPRSEPRLKAGQV